MLKPYIRALRTPFCLDPDFLVKKETVNGINGNTQGVIKAISPPRKPKKKIADRLLPPVSRSPQEFTECSISIEGILILVEVDTPPSSGTENKKDVEG